MTGICQSRDIVSQGAINWGPGVPEHSYEDKSFWDVLSPHHVHCNLQGSHFLADLNNFKEEKNPLYKEAMERLANFVMIMWEDDQTIIPPISSHMGFYQLGQDNVTVSLQVQSLDQMSSLICCLDLE